MSRLFRRAFLAGIAVAAALAASTTHAVPVVVDYDIAATGQSARASFEFLDATRLQISLSETTAAGASDLTGGSAILTSLGFLLPRVRIVGGSVVIGPGSITAGFTGAELTGGADVSNLWGYTPTSLKSSLQATSAQLAADAAAQSRIAAEQEAIETAKRARAKAQRDAAAQLLANNPDPQMKADAADLIKAAERDEADAAAAHALADQARAQAAALQSQSDDLAARALTAPSFQVVGALWSPLTAFFASPPGTSFDGLDGGLIADALARGSERVVVDSVLLSLTLSHALLADEQAAFLAGLRTGSRVGYGFGGFFGGTPDVPPVSVSEPTMTSLAAAALLLLCWPAWFHRTRRTSPH